MPLALLGLGAIAAPEAAPPPAEVPVVTRPLATRTPAAAPPKAMGCLIEPHRQVELGAQVVGVIDRYAVDRGDAVRRGQRVVALRADVERANLEVARWRSTVDAERLAAEANVELAHGKHERAQALQAQGFVSTEAVSQSRTELQVARQRLAQAHAQQQLYAREQRVAEAQVGLRELRSPIDGIVVERYADDGERVEDKPLLRVAVVNPLRVELMVPVAQYGRLQPGDRVAIQPELPSAGPQQARVTHIDRVMDPASNTFRVRLTLPNPGNRLPAGLRCKAELPAEGSAPPTKADPVVPTATTTPTRRGARTASREQAAKARAAQRRAA